MSRQVARTRKKHKAGDADSKFEVLRKIHQTSSITSKDIVQLYSIDKPLCHGCRVNSRDSPNCFCGLVPTSSGSRRNGLWQKLSDLVTSVVGLDPSVDQRSPEDCPAGLTNAGATCYANSILQCLYMNVKFRAGIFSVEPDLLKQHLVLEQLVHLFSQLHSSRKAVIDSLPFVKMLELDKGSQQDSHEFLTLFLSLLERSLSHSKVHRAKMLVQDLFRGSVSHVTRCSMCGKDSEASSKVDDFYGLELYIKGFDNLDSSLDDYLSVEHLCGQNQYFCQSCNIRVDATRCIKLRALPAVLIFQLKRYDFLMEMTKKKKLTSSFSFPNQLNMGTRLDAASDTKLWYDLSAVLIHKGSAATSGHYVARIKDENNGIWWEFDDETVIKLGHQPFGESLSVTTGGVQSTSNGTKEHPEIFSPTDAYMLIYCCTHSQKYVDLDARDAGMVVPNNNSALPAHLSEKIEIANGLFIEACRNYQAKKDALIAHITERRLEVKQILSEAQVHSIEDCFFWVSLDWLRQWADSFDLPWADQSNLMQVDNSVIQCSHGKVSADKVSSMKRMSVSAWSKIFYKYGGGPALSNDDYCVECLKEEALNYVSADDYRDRSITMKRIAEAALAGDCDDGESYYVSRTWLSHWLRRKHLDNPCDLEAGPTSSLICPHGNMLPEKASGAKRVRIPENLWLFLLESINAAKSGTFSHQAFPEEDSQTCKTCSKELSDFASLASTLRESKLNQQQSHEKLFLGKTISLSPGHKYFLMPSSWLAKWKAYITTTGRGGSSTEPECLGVIINSFKCHKHGRLLERPPKLICKRGLITHSSNVDGLTMVPESDWKLFCKEWKADEERGLSAQVVPVKEAESGRVFLSDPEICSRSPDVPTSCELEPEDLTIRTDTEICEVCIGERESCELMHKLNYSDGEISVHLIRGKEVPKWLLEAHIAKASDPDRRTSKRSRRSLSGQVCNLSVSSTTTVYQLRMMIWEYFGVVKENQKLHKGSVELEGDSATLADKNIFPGDALWVSDSQVHENRDIAEELSEPKSESREAEEGFRGTLLVSDASPFVFEDKGE